MAWQLDLPHRRSGARHRIDRKAGRSREDAGVLVVRGDDVPCIVGGNDGRYVAYFAHDVDRQLFNLVDATSDAAETVLKVVTGARPDSFLAEAAWPARPWKGQRPIRQARRRRPGPVLGSCLSAVGAGAMHKFKINFQGGPVQETPISATVEPTAGRR